MIKVNIKKTYCISTVYNIYPINSYFKINAQYPQYILLKGLCRTKVIIKGSVPLFEMLHSLAAVLKISFSN